MALLAALRATRHTHRNFSTLSRPIFAHKLRGNAVAYPALVPRRTFVFRPISAIGKFVGRTVLTTGGTVAATVGYYNQHLKDWTDRMREGVADAAGFLSQFELPDFSDFQLSREISDILATMAKVPAQTTAATPLSPPGDPTPAAAAAVPVDSADGNTDAGDTDQQSSQRGNQFMELTKRMIEVRTILRSVHANSDSLQLPSIVVIGSQSSGKSSLLESIIGHQFLPKGQNMVTRRPIEITLVHTPDATEEYAEFPAQGLGKIHNFKEVGTVLTDLNLSVSEAECVSDDPIDLRIYSPNVPDLTLIDLPGYIALNNRRQPAALKENIKRLCRKYLQEPNIILAVCSADVDLANSEALNESRLVDPHGQRTLGVLTKLDLVDPERAVGLLKNDEFPLELGYFGVIAAQPQMRALARGKQNISAEEAYYRTHMAQFAAVGDSIGVRTLQRNLIKVLEGNMAKSLTGIVSAVRSELDETRYQFKVQFNDRKITPEAYLSTLLDFLKRGFVEYDRSAIRTDIRQTLDRRLVEVASALFWDDPKIQELSASSRLSEDDARYWEAVMIRAHALLTKSGLGRMTTQLVVDHIKQSLDTVLASDKFACHSETRDKILKLADDLLRNKFQLAVDQVENAIKPYKYDLDLNEHEWTAALRSVTGVLKAEQVETQRSLDEIKKEVGKRQLYSAMQHVQHHASKLHEAIDADESVERQLQFSPMLIAKATEAIRLQRRNTMLTLRLGMLQPGWFSYPACAAHKVLKDTGCLVRCPEPYLAVIADKMTHAATMFLWVELVNEFFYQFPREVDKRLYFNLSQEEISRFAQQNPTIASHLALQSKVQALETAMEKLMFLYRQREYYTKQK